jgi:hypothetical protein
LAFLFYVSRSWRAGCLLILVPSVQNACV